MRPPVEVADEDTDPPVEPVVESGTKYITLGEIIIYKAGNTNLFKDIEKKGVDNFGTKYSKKYSKNDKQYLKELNTKVILTSFKEFYINHDILEDFICPDPEKVKDILSNEITQYDINEFKDNQYKIPDKLLSPEGKPWKKGELIQYKYENKENNESIVKHSRIRDFRAL